MPTTMTRAQKADYIADLCADNNCTEEKCKAHAKIYLERGWLCHPSRAFRDWWEPNGFALNGASVGGHREARRAWVKLETGEERWYGIGATQAFNTEPFRAEFRQWLRDGMNPDHHNWNSTTAPEDRIRAVFAECRRIMAGSPINKPKLKSLRQKLDNTPSPNLDTTGS